MMANGRKTRWAVLAGAAALVGGLLTTMPAFGNEQVVRLHLGTDAQSFSYANTTQDLTTARNGCQLTSAEPVIDLKSVTAGGSSSPGLASNSIGVKSSGSNSNGTPCSQIDNIETLQIRPGTTMEGRAFSKLRLDLEMTGNAVVVITLKSGTNQVGLPYRLQTGTSIDLAQTLEEGYDSTAPYEVSSSPGDEIDACAAPNSSGPNSGNNDNCLWTIDPGAAFNLIEITTTIGTATLEGSGDFGNDAIYDSLFYLSNRAPIAVADSFATSEDAEDAALGNVLSGDSDPDGDPLTVTEIENQATLHGTVSVTPAGAVTYTPAPNFYGEDSFQYTISDGKGGTATATVTINVAPVNDPPVAFDDSAQTSVGIAVTIPVLANDTDIDGDPLRVQSWTQGAKGSVVPNDDGTVTYTPDSTFSGDDSFDYVVSDGEGGTDTGTVMITEVICPGTTITVPPEVVGGTVTGSFTFMTTDAECKPFDAEAVELEGTVLFQPTGGDTVKYRAVLRLSPKDAPTGPGFGAFDLLLEYDPLGGNIFRPVPWCINPHFTDGMVTAATIPDSATEKWCVASAHTVPVTGSSPQTLATEWQVYGEDDPKFR